MSIKEFRFVVDDAGILFPISSVRLEDNPLEIQGIAQVSPPHVVALETSGDDGNIEVHWIDGQETPGNELARRFAQPTTALPETTIVITARSGSMFRKGLNDKMVSTKPQIKTPA